MPSYSLTLQIFFQMGILHVFLVSLFLPALPVQYVSSVLSVSHTQLVLLLSLTYAILLQYKTSILSERSLTCFSCLTCLTCPICLICLTCLASLTYLTSRPWTRTATVSSRSTSGSTMRSSISCKRYQNARMFLNQTNILSNNPFFYIKLALHNSLFEFFHF